jgi:hypothetical protein
MSGGLLQLVVYGVEDLILTGDPQISLFKWSYKRYSNFMRSPHLLKERNSTFGERLAFTLNVGDIIDSIWIKVTFPRLKRTNTMFAYAHYPMCSLLDTAIIRAENQVLYELTGEWIYIWDCLTTAYEKQESWNKLAGHSDSMIKFTSTKELTTCYLRLPFWDKVSSGLPLVSLWEQNVVLELKFQPIEKVLFEATWNSSASQYDISNAQMASFSSLPRLKVGVELEIIYLDDFEKKYFQEREHSTWIHQVSVDSYTSELTVIQNDIHFTRPLVEIIWTIQSSEAVLPFDFTKTIQKSETSTDINESPFFIPVTSTDSIASAIKLSVNDIDVVSQRSPLYFTQIQQFKHHTRIHSDGGIHVYSFALNPESNSPSGHCGAGTIRLHQELDFFNGNLGSTSHTLRIYKVTLNRFDYSGGSVKVLFP